MPKLAKELSALAVKNLNSPGVWFVGGVPGLALQVKNSGTRSWIFRVVIGGRRRDMGIGPYPAVGVAEARKKAIEARNLVRQGVAAAGGFERTACQISLVSNVQRGSARIYRCA